MDLGLSQYAAEYIVEYIDSEGSILSQWEIDPTALALIADLHNGSWCRVGQMETILVTAKGGRQGCKFGSIVFNSAYAI
eukprot:6382332-Karenia_brevis.AAC.1